MLGVCGGVQSGERSKIYGARCEGKERFWGSWQSKSGETWGGESGEDEKLRLRDDNRTQAQSKLEHSTLPFKDCLDAFYGFCMCCRCHLVDGQLPRNLRSN